MVGLLLLVVVIVLSHTSTLFVHVLVVYPEKLTCFLFFLTNKKRLVKIKEWIDAHDPGSMVIPLSGALESKLLDMADDEERKKYCEEVKTQR